ncbi:AraC family transcriptional regulator [Persicobacter diffluens]|uniref:HTH araC/xylS-type domain-containing protein n=1 Tax=Persicobacter diffluens TaxID=981 RepID=A0AAN5ANY5_9BACT|nr:hypothetical protein PEDI_43430 [Persicobacter diffluens]
MDIAVKNMVCPRCIQKVEEIFLAENLKPEFISLGLVKLATSPSKSALESLDRHLKKEGFDLLTDRNRQLIDRIKSLLVEWIGNEQQQSQSLMEYVQENLNMEYSGLSKLFSQVEGRTIERYFISLKMEKAKEWLTYGEWSVGQIADRLAYQNAQHFSRAFKKETGLSPTEFRKLQSPDRKALDQL